MVILIFWCFDPLCTYSKWALVKRNLAGKYLNSISSLSHFYSSAKNASAADQYLFVQNLAVLNFCCVYLSICFGLLEKKLLEHKFFILIVIVVVVCCPQKLHGSELFLTCNIFISLALPSHVLCSLKQSILWHLIQA